MGKLWKIQIHDGNSGEARSYDSVPDFAAVRIRLHSFKASPTTDVFRVFPPTDATAAEIRELSESGATTG